MRNPVALYHCSTITISSMSIVSVHPLPLPSSPMTRPLPSTKQHVKIFSVFRPLLPNCSQLVTSETGNGINSCFTDTCDTCPTLQLLAQHSVPQCPRRVCLKQKLWYTCWNRKQNYKLHVSVGYLWHGTPRHHGREMPPYASFLRRRDPTRDQRTTSPCTSACACSASRSPSPGSWSGTSPGWCRPAPGGETHRCGGQWPGHGQGHPQHSVQRREYRHKAYLHSVLVWVGLVSDGGKMVQEHHHPLLVLQNERIHHLHVRFLAPEFH